MADEGQVRELFGADEEILRLLEREHVLEGRRLARRGVPVHHVLFDARVRQAPQPRHVLPAEVERGPVEHLARGSVIVAVVHAPGDRGVVVAQHRELALAPDQIAGRVRVRAVADRVAEADEALDSRSLSGFDTGRQRFDVGVDVGEDSGPHRRRTEYTACRATSRR